MKTRCPACGATASLDALLGHSEASQAFLQSLKLTGDLAKPLVKYLGLFRSDSRELTFERAGKLIGELAHDIAAQQITRNRQTYQAPTAAWIWAINTMLERRDQGKLQTPLKNHGYLYEVISSYKADLHPTEPTAPIAMADSRSMLDKISAKQQEQNYQQQLQQHERQKRQKPAVNLSEMMLFNKTAQQQQRCLNGVPADQLLAYVMQHKLDGETTEQCYQRLKALETQTETD